PPALENDTSNETPEFQPGAVDYAESDNHPGQDEKRIPEATHTGFPLVVWQTLQAPQSAVVIFSWGINRAKNSLVARDKPSHVHRGNEIHPLRVAAAAFFDQASLAV